LKLFDLSGLGQSSNLKRHRQFFFVYQFFWPLGGLLLLDLAERSDAERDALLQQIQPMAFFFGFQKKKQM
jgi:hypothetical protein